MNYFIIKKLEIEFNYLFSRMISHPIAILPRYITEIPEPIEAKVVVVEAKDVQTTLKLFPTSAR